MSMTVCLGLSLIAFTQVLPGSMIITADSSLKECVKGEIGVESCFIEKMWYSFNNNLKYTKMVQKLMKNCRSFFGERSLIDILMSEESNSESTLGWANSHWGIPIPRRCTPEQKKKRKKEKSRKQSLKRYLVSGYQRPIRFFKKLSSR